MKKAHNDHDVAWYNRLIQELDWVEQMSGVRPYRNCYMEEGKEEMEIKVYTKSDCPFCDMTKKWFRRKWI